ncbi:MAG: MobA/MobL family protein [Pseudomonadota bacterium]|nr:MobA/MobL family protein [Pseudomonadota bacterium]
MAIYHLSVKPISRKGGRSATAAAAYRAAEKIHDLTSDQVFDYTRKRGVEHAEIVLPTEAARRDINWARDRQALWNAAEASENRSNSRVAREYEIALPHELNREQRVELVRAFSKDLADRYGIGVDFAIHAPHRHGDERNHHAHVLTTTRTIEAGGLGAKSEIEWSDGNRRKAGLGPAKEEITVIRERWETLTNEYLKEHGIEARIDHRSLEAQGIEREPQSHLGPAVSGMERRGIETEVGKRLDAEALAAAQQRLERAAELGKIERERAQLERSILDLSGDLQSAKRERERQVSEPLATKPQSVQEIQRQAREAWLALRAEQRAAELAAEQTPQKAAEKTREPARESTLTLDEQRAESVRRWLEYRQNPEQNLDPPTRGQEHEGPEMEID